MFARRTLPQIVTKLAIGLGALFLVGVLLAAIPNHRAPVVTGSSAPSARGTAKQDRKGAAQDMTPKRHSDSAQSHMASPKAADSRH